LGADESIQFAGPVSVTLDTIPSTAPQTVVVFCDDLVHSFAPNHTYNNYFASDPAAPIDIINYIDLGTTKAEQVMGLTALGTNDYLLGTLTPERGAAIQMAIWEIEKSSMAAPPHSPAMRTSRA
jgi:hypothetical protein